MRSGIINGVRLSVLLVVPIVTALAWGAKPPVAFDHQHTLFDNVLRKYVKNGLVNYKVLRNDQAVLSHYLQVLADIDPKSYEMWTHQQKLALWINAYNAYTIKVILDHYPIKPSWLADPLGHYPPDSIRQIPGVWDKLTWPIMGKEYTLDQMEHVIMRKQLAEPRVHFVLVCASIGCPLLENRAFDATHLEQRLDQAVVNYIYRDHKVHIDKRNRVVGLPRTFEWFGEDFQPASDSPEIFRTATKGAGIVKHSDLTGNEIARIPATNAKEAAGPLSWVYRYANEEDRAFLATGNYKVIYLHYDWHLNELR
jgi:hypothetical protein